MLTLHKAVIHVSWDTFDLRQIDEAKGKYIQAKREGRRITTVDGYPLERFNSNLGELLINEEEVGDSHFAMRILDETGDRRLIWDSRDPRQVKEASELFAEHIKKGGRAYGIRKDGTKGIRLFGFDGRKEEVVIDELGTRERLKNFAKQFTEIKMLPRTYPG